jgi:pSer/pThr/pTyr-binding forkhead associated (FHA) protein
MEAASPLAPHRARPVELKERFEADRLGIPYLVYRDAADRQKLCRLDPARQELTIGRRPSNDVSLDWDAEVSRVHAELTRVGEDWALVDDGLSSNGTFVNGVRIGGRRRLQDGDEIRIGTTVIAFRAPARGDSRTTAAADELATLPRLNETQRAVLIALARPFKDSSGFATPATNKQIAADLVMSVDGVKSALRALFQKFGLGDIPQNQKRLRLVERAFQLGAIAEDDL